MQTALAGAAKPRRVGAALPQATHPASGNAPSGERPLVGRRSPL